MEQEKGARCYKWEFESGMNGDMENDFGIFRMADVYLMKAEALVRMGTGSDEATRLMNVILSRAFDDASKLKISVTLDDIYQERRFELAWEGYGRQDQIRFGTFRNAIPGWKNASDDIMSYSLGGAE
ncbi:MAG: RagB/SusD family nutrient uptake outer membrane protein [Mangrovibacterium sp.]